MKILLSYLLLVIYATIMIKPVMPTVSDIFAHLFNYRDHMITVHHHHGKDHVHFEYIEAAKKNAHGEASNNNLSKKAIETSEYLMFTSSLNPLLYSIPQKYSCSYFKKVQAICPEGHFHPPTRPRII